MFNWVQIKDAAYNFLFGSDNPGYVKVAPGTEIMGKVGIDQTTPGVTNAVALTGSSPEVSSDQDTQVATTVQTYNRPAGASQIELYVETGYVRVRTDGQPCTGTTGEPIAAGFGSAWRAESISVYYIQESVITVVSR